MPKPPLLPFPHIHRALSMSTPIHYDTSVSWAPAKRNKEMENACASDVDADVLYMFVDVHLDMVASYDLVHCLWVDMDIVGVGGAAMENKNWQNDQQTIAPVAACVPL